MTTAAFVRMLLMYFYYLVKGMGSNTISCSHLSININKKIDIHINNEEYMNITLILY